MNMLLGVAFIQQIVMGSQTDQDKTIQVSKDQAKDGEYQDVV